MYKRMLLVGLLLALAVVPTAVAQAPSVVKIGVIVSEVGPASPLGNAAVKAIQLAKEDLKNTSHQYELLIEDAGTSPDQATRAIEKLITVDKVDALVVGLSINGKVIRPYATAAKIPLLCLCSIGNVGDGLYNFTTMPLAEDEAARWTTEAKRRGIKRIALLIQDYPSINNHVRMLKADGAQAGMAVVYEDRFDPSTVDFRSSRGGEGHHSRRVLCRRFRPHARSPRPTAQGCRRPRGRNDRHILAEWKAGIVRGRLVYGQLHQPAVQSATRSEIS